MSMYLLIGFMFMILSLLSLGAGLVLMMSEKVYLFEYMLFSFFDVDIKYEVLLDWVALIYLGVVLLISGSVLIYSEDYMDGDLNKIRFISLMVSFVISMILMVISGGLISVLLGWDGLGLVSYCLVIYYSSSNSYKAGMITILSNRVGDTLLLVSIGWLLMKGDWNFWFYNYEEFKLPDFVIIMIILAACTKSAQVPFSAWLPEAMAAPTPVSSLVHSSTLVTAGVYLMIRFNYFFLESSNLLMFMSLMTLSVAGFGALVETDMKKMVAMSTLSQLGFMMFCVSVGLWKIAYFHMMIHAFFKALMFLCVGSIIHGMMGNQDFRLIEKKVKVSWMVNQGLLISVLCLVGFPFFCGFFSKDLILEIFIMQEKNYFMMILFFFGVSSSSMYGMRLFLGSMMGNGMEMSMMNYSESNWMNVGIGILLAISLVSGSFMSWMFKFNYTVMMNSGFKLIGLFMIMLLIPFMIMSFHNYLYLKSEKIFLYNYFGSMWFMSLMTSSMWETKVKWSGEIEKFDQEWMEEYGGGGIKKFLVEEFFYIYDIFQSKKYFSFIFNFIIFIVLIFLVEILK